MILSLSAAYAVLLILQLVHSRPITGGAPQILSQVIAQKQSLLSSLEAQADAQIVSDPNLSAVDKQNAVISVNQLLKQQDTGSCGTTCSSCAAQVCAAPQCSITQAIPPIILTPPISAPPLVYPIASTPPTIPYFPPVIPPPIQPRNDIGSPPPNLNTPSSPTPDLPSSTASPPFTTPPPPSLPPPELPSTPPTSPSRVLDAREDPTPSSGNELPIQTPSPPPTDLPPAPTSPAVASPPSQDLPPNPNPSPPSQHDLPSETLGNPDPKTPTARDLPVPTANYGLPVEPSSLCPEVETVTGTLVPVTVCEEASPRTTLVTECDTEQTTTGTLVQVTECPDEPTLTVTPTITSYPDCPDAEEDEEDEECDDECDGDEDDEEDGDCDKGGDDDHWHTHTRHTHSTHRSTTQATRTISNTATRSRTVGTTTIFVTITPPPPPPDDKDNDCTGDDPDDDEIDAEYCVDESVLRDIGELDRKCGFEETCEITDSTQPVESSKTVQESTSTVTVSVDADSSKQSTHNKTCSTCHEITTIDEELCAAIPKGKKVVAKVVQKSSDGATTGSCAAQETAGSHIATLRFDANSAKTIVDAAIKARSQLDNLPKMPGLPSLKTVPYLVRHAKKRPMGIESQSAHESGNISNIKPAAKSVGGMNILDTLNL